jgi:glycosyltransferase involved in cell wall biosynthesis
MSFLTALREYSIKRLESIGNADILIGIPGHNNDQTIHYVLKTASHGAREYFPGMRVVLFVSDGGSTDDTRDEASIMNVDPFTEKLIQIYRGLPGKGSALRAIFESAAYLKVKGTLVLDADLRSITPDWIQKMLTPVISGEYDYVAPFYSRYKYDGTITNNITYNMTRMLYGKRIRQPIGGDFCFSPQLVERFLKENVWDTDVATFGIDIWMTTMAITEKYRLSQARLGVKLHGKKDPGSELGEMFREVVITMFSLMENYEKVWKKVKGSTNVDIVGEEPEQEPEAFPVDKELLVENFKVGYNHFSAFWKSILSKEDMKMIREMHKLKPDELHMDIDLWARILFDFAATFHKWSRNKVKLINMLTPLYYANVASFINRTDTMSNEEAEQVIEEYARRFEDLKPYLVKKWDKAASG